ncbi:exodeoxyribonuclease V subunit alpha [Castellaniella sp. UC4442_H9]
MRRTAVGESPVRAVSAESGAAPFPGWLAYPAVQGLRDLDVALGRFLVRQAPQAPETAVRLAVLCSARLAQGHPCLDMAQLCRHWHTELPEDWRVEAGGHRPAWLPPDPDACRSALMAAAFVGDGAGEEPLVLHAHRLYLARYWRAAARIRAGIAARLSSPAVESENAASARSWLDRVFTPGDGALDWQKIACANALLHDFCIITGGPGTGKTTTVVRLLAVLQGLAQERGLTRGLRICLAAPTGKAAARLSESIAGRLDELRHRADTALQAAMERIPAEVVTLHRLLGSRPDTRRLVYHAGHPLDLDVLVVDEASMMDIEMMDATLAALPESARLVLLGDRDQLASVEAGAVLGELCARAPQGHYRPDHCERLRAFCGQAPAARWQDEEGTPLDQGVVMLRHSHRFDENSGIGRFAAAVNTQDTAAVAALYDQPLPGLRFLPLQGTSGSGAPAHWLEDAGVLGPSGYPALFRTVQDAMPSVDAVRPAWDRWARSVLECQARFQVLCALRTGPWGVEGLNRLIESRLRALGRIAPDAGPWYLGRPILVTRNQPGLGLANGDIGVVLNLPDPRHAGRRVLRAAFAGSGEGRVRWVSPARLSDIETVYALTVHKSQGSEFDHVVLVLPERPGPLLTRELLYTGATRARESLVLVLPGSPALLDEAVRHATHRAGGIWDPDA